MTIQMMTSRMAISLQVEGGTEDEADENLVHAEHGGETEQEAGQDDDDGGQPLFDGEKAVFSWVSSGLGRPRGGGPAVSAVGDLFFYSVVRPLATLSGHGWPGSTECVLRIGYVAYLTSMIFLMLASPNSLL